MQSKESAIFKYFGKDNLQRFLTAYLERHGDNENTRGTLMLLATYDQEKFLDLLCDFMDKESV